MRKIVCLVAMAAGLLLMAVFAMIFLLPRLIDLESVKTKTMAAISERIGSEVHFDQVKLSYFPVVSVTAFGLSATMSGHASVSAESLTVYPSIIRLLSGEVQIADLQIQSPVFVVRYDKRKPLIEKDIDKEIAELLELLHAISRSLDMSVRDGRLTMSAEGGASISVKDIDIDADFGRSSTEIKVVGGADFIKRIDLDIDLQMQDKAITKVALNINAKEIDLGRARETVLPMAEDIHTIGTIFSHLRSGNIPDLSVKSEAVSISALGKAENIVVRGHLNGGRLHVPGAALDFRGLNASFSVAKGLLEAGSMTAILDRTVLRNGRLKVGLQHGDVPFRIETDITSTIADAVDITRTLLKDSPAMLLRLKSLNGPFEGRLVIGESASIFRTGSDFKNGSIRLTALMRTDFAKKIKLDLNFRQGGGPAGTRLDIEMREADMKQAESGLRGLSREIPAFKKVFSYIPFGLVPVITFSAKGAAPGDLGDLGHFVIRGQLAGGAVVIPESGLSFNRVNGAYTVENGVLEASDVRGEMNGGSLKNGVLKVSLGKGNGPFHLDADLALTAEAAQQLQRQFVKEPTFPLDRLRDLKGMLTGKISLGENTAALSSWKEQGIFGFDGRIDLTGGPAVDLNLKVMPGGVRIKKLRFQDAQSNAALSLNYEDKHINGQFDGTLTTETLSKVIRMPEMQKGSVRGSFSAAIDPEATSKTTVSGRLSIAGMPVRLKDGLQMNIKTMDIRAATGSFYIDSAAMKIGDMDFAVRGTIKPGKVRAKALVLDTDISAGRIDWASVKQLLPKSEAGAQNGLKAAEEPLSVSGVIRLSAENFIWDKYSISPLKAEINLARDKTVINLGEAAFCGISSPGRIVLEKDIIDLSFTLSANDRELLSTAACLSNQTSKIKGTFSLKGNLKGRGKSGELLRSLKGDLSFTARNGGIDKAPALSRVLAFMDLSETFKGSIPDVGKEQLPYRSIKADCDIKNGKLLIREAVMDAPAFEMVATGEIDYVSDQVDIKLLAAPLRTLDSVLKKIPLVSAISGGSLLAVPVHVTGKFSELKTEYLPLSGVGGGLIGAMERTVKLPVTIFQPSAAPEKK